MNTTHHSGQAQTQAGRLAHRLAAHAQAILGYQELIIDEVREAGLSAALDDLQRVFEAAVTLNRHIDDLAGIASPLAPEAEATLRHDLRTPINAILGYSEMVREDFEEVLSARVLEDLCTVVREARTLLEQIDAIGTPDPGDTLSAGDVERTIAADLARTISAQPAPPTGEPGRILVVDDSETNRDLLTRRLRRDGHTVSTANTGREALLLLETLEVDLILLDILMPDMNGLELLARLKRDERLRDIPVLMVTGLKEEDAVFRCIASGAEDYLPKPVDTVLLRARISASLERKRWREREMAYIAEIEAQKDRANILLHSILPAQVVRRLEGGEAVIADRFEDATIIFADIVDFTPMAARTAPAALVQHLGALFSRFDELADHYGIEKIKTIGDAYMAASGIPEPRADHAVAAVAFARALMHDVANPENGAPPIALRIGIHSGPVIAGLIGRKRFVYDIWGHTVNLASRLEAHGFPGRIQISHSTLKALGETAEIVPKGRVHLKGIGDVPTYLLMPE
ncbi:adenylate/guanylate cyclase domain-containing protein [Acuticoccus kandeliae]|uniref:adenylate/guanylate cyclase domain-containing protein n=1 Tax=Acuticoccus kandeliae TaxID=2073160 RepID=UPI000D3E874A|nr:adenylate/guanylate cyclase domain-containing protein [Acuticoccus kandeliae]